MPNNIVFNPVAEQLKTLIHGMQGTTPTPLLLDPTTGKLLSTVDGSVTVAGTVTAQGTLTVTSSNFDIRPLTGATDSVTISSGSVTVAGTVTVTASALDIRPITASTDSVTLGSRTFLEDSTAIAGVTGTGVVLMENTGNKSMYSYYITNTGTNTIAVKLQISPTTTDTYFVDDTTSINLAGGSITVLTAVKFMQYTRLYYDTGGAAATAEFYYNAQV
ncbi:DUF6385 domain-containing protein [Thermoanaerobacterium thermosaccharolyticum]|jgi:hypothetical protein|uniref:DUF6385 domain-containing protein n=1 Tax=Thermoanaerobacterium thermosaccharolyticum TaxID=1517 RepID=UPI00279BDA01|nr:DUF6385 domain-containing protein [Thermoanaerobacterium thermosaccharolyticum]